MSKTLEEIESDLRVLQQIDDEVRRLRDKRDVQRLIIRVREAKSAGKSKTELLNLFPSSREDRKRLAVAIQTALDMGRIFKRGKRYYINSMADKWDKEAGIL